MMKNERNRCSRWTLSSVGIVSVSASIGIMVMLATTDDNCEYSLRSYLRLFTLVLLLLGLPMIFVELCCSRCLLSNTGLIIYTIFISLVVIIVFWVQIVGLLILGSDEECGTEFTSGYQATLSVAGTVLLLTGVGVASFIFWALKENLDSRKGYQNLNNEN